MSKPIDDHLEELLGHQHDGELTPEEAAELQALLAADREAAAAAQADAGLVATLRAARNRRAPASVMEAVRAGMAGEQPPTPEVHPAPVPIGPRTPRRRYAWQLAAAACFLAVGGVAYFAAYQNGYDQDPASETADLAPRRLKAEAEPQPAASAPAPAPSRNAQVGDVMRRSDNAAMLISRAEQQAEEAERAETMAFFTQQADLPGPEGASQITNAPAEDMMKSQAATLAAEEMAPPAEAPGATTSEDAFSGDAGAEPFGAVAAAARFAQPSTLAPENLLPYQQLGPAVESPGTTLLLDTASRQRAEAALRGQQLPEAADRTAGTRFLVLQAAPHDADAQKDALLSGAIARDGDRALYAYAPPSSATDSYLAQWVSSLERERRPGAVAGSSTTNEAAPALTNERARRLAQHEQRIGQLLEKRRQETRERLVEGPPQADAFASDAELSSKAQLAEEDEGATWRVVSERNPDSEPVETPAVLADLRGVTGALDGAPSTPAAVPTDKPGASPEENAALRRRGIDELLANRRAERESEPLAATSAPAEKQQDASREIRSMLRGNYPPYNRDRPAETATASPSPSPDPSPTAAAEARPHIVVLESWAEGLLLLLEFDATGAEMEALEDGRVRVILPPPDGS